MKKGIDHSNCSNRTEKLMPIVNFNNCSGKKDCVEICPYNVFELRSITKEDKTNLNIKGRIKTFFISQKAYVINPSQCHTCGLCVKVCPEKAIKLTRYAKETE